jgi:glutamate-1-semialdehyde aminotransferase
VTEAKRETPPPAPSDHAAAPSRFEIFKGGRAGASLEITPLQSKHIAELVENYTRRTPGSKAFTERHRKVLADPRAVSGFRSEWKEMIYPIVTERSSGTRLWDVDGNEYIDFLNGFGPTFFGHGQELVVEAVKEQLARGFEIGPQTALAGEVAALVCELTGNERATFCNTGSEAVMAAMRIARCVTDRERIVMFTGSYHGQFDEVLVKRGGRAGAEHASPVAPGIPPQNVANMTVLDYADLKSLEWIRAHAGELAAVIVEPVQSRHPGLCPAEFLRELRAITEAAGAALVFDEVVTGFRMHPGGMQALLGIRADLATYGKVAGGGLPIGILAGKAAFMDALDGGQWTYGDDSAPEVGVTFFAGTFVRHPLAMAAARAVLRRLKDTGPALQEGLEQRTGTFVARLNEILAERRLATRVETYGSLFYFTFAAESHLASLLYFHMRLRGVHILEGFPCFLTTAHTEEDLNRFVEAFRESIDALRGAGILGETAETAAKELALPVPAMEPSLTEAPLTEPQLEIWLAAQLSDQASCAFNESLTIHLQGALREAALSDAFNAVVARHDALRTRFSPSGERLHIAPDLRIDISRCDLSRLSEGAIPDALRALTVAPRNVFSAGRRRSEGNSSTGGAAANILCQYSSAALMPPLVRNPSC